MPSEAAMKAAESFSGCPESRIKELAVIIDTAIQEACGPLVNAAWAAIDRCTNNVAMTQEDEAWCLGDLRDILNKWQSQPERAQRGGE